MPELKASRRGAIEAGGQAHSSWLPPPHRYLRSSNRLAVFYYELSCNCPEYQFVFICGGGVSLNSIPN